MDTQSLVTKLNKVFCNTNRAGIKYSDVWLTEANLGGLYRNGKYVLNVKAEHAVVSCFDETESIIRLLRSEAADEARMIWTVNVYDINDSIRCVDCGDEGIEVYNEAYAPCAAAE